MSPSQQHLDLLRHAMRLRFELQAFCDEAGLQTRECIRRSLQLLQATEAMVDPRLSGRPLAARGFTSGHESR